MDQVQHELFLRFNRGILEQRNQNRFFYHTAHSHKKLCVCLDRARTGKSVGYIDHFTFNGSNHAIIGAHVPDEQHRSSGTVGSFLLLLAPFFSFSAFSLFMRDNLCHNAQSPFVQPRQMPTQTTGKSFLSFFFNFRLKDMYRYTGCMWY